MSVSKTVGQWADHLVEQAKQKAAKKIGVGDGDEMSFNDPLFPPKPPARSLPAASDIELPPQRHAFGEGPREGEESDDMISSFFDDEGDRRRREARDSEKRKEKKTGQRSNPTQSYRSVERVAYSSRSFQIDRYVAPPGMENVVRRLKTKEGVSNPYAVAWGMYDRDKHTHDNVIGGLSRIGVLEGALHRSLRVLDAVAEGHYGVSKEVVSRLHSDALEDIERSFDREDPLRDAWKHVLNQAKSEALSKVSRHSEQGPPEVESVEEREPEFPRDEMLEEMTGKGKGLDKCEEYRVGWITFR